ncbi:unnamed protein product [Ceratitis capitata]|uniref:(Mediterranean fruit fly) hypothetical protein n=1 Tax=Ceratitis capitata TaxID=7213 RepID=A0A811UR04_CERCA|nr:unnamed protein product [Ceratitis capitata]
MRQRRQWLQLHFRVRQQQGGHTSASAAQNTFFKLKETMKRMGEWGLHLVAHLHLTSASAVSV